jgi:ABC-type Zn2+ transport system substrate-binding protein/surface adhesin
MRGDYAMHLIKDENGNLIAHGHDHHDHEHTHEDGTTHTHPHSHADGEGHEHSHGTMDCTNCSGGDCKNESVALLTYMCQHNEHHAAELDQMADNLQKLGMQGAAHAIREAVSDFQKGNMRLNLALTVLKDELK